MKAGQYMVVPGSYSCTQHTCFAGPAGFRLLLYQEECPHPYPPWPFTGLGEMFSLAVCKCRHPTLACASLVASRLSHGSHTTALISIHPHVFSCFSALTFVTVP